MTTTSIPLSTHRTHLPSHPFLLQSKNFQLNYINSLLLPPMHSPSLFQCSHHTFFYLTSFCYSPHYLLIVNHNPGRGTRGYLNNPGGCKQNVLKNNLGRWGTLKTASAQDDVTGDGTTIKRSNKNPFLKMFLTCAQSPKSSKSRNGIVRRKK